LKPETFSNKDDARCIVALSTLNQGKLKLISAAFAQFLDKIKLSASCRQQTQSTFGGAMLQHAFHDCTETKLVATCWLPLLFEMMSQYALPATACKWLHTSQQQHQHYSANSHMPSSNFMHVVDEVGSSCSCRCRPFFLAFIVGYPR